MNDKMGQCEGQVYDASGWGRFYRCTRSAIVDRDRKHYCKIHDPEYVKTKHEKKQAESEAKWAKERAYRELQNTGVSQCKSINPDNPMAVAKSIKDMYEALRFTFYWLSTEYPDNPETKEIVEVLSKIEGKNEW